VHNNVSNPHLVFLPHSIWRGIFDNVVAMGRLGWLFVVLSVGCGRTTFFGVGASGGDDDGGTGPNMGVTGGPDGTGGFSGADGSSSTGRMTVTATATITDTDTATTVGPGETTDDDTSDSGSTGALTCADDPAACQVELHLRRAVDILFVIDNSGSMGAEQGTLAQSFASFIEVLEAQEVGANYRIGVTTSSGDGVLRATSCRSRLFEFTFQWQFGTIDEQQTGCLDNCDIDVLNLPDPWVEKGDGGTNIPAGLTMAEVLQCIGPQGINGPGFERPLEAMRSAILDPASDFLRDDALLAVVFVTDEADCSMSPENELWAKTDGTVFWTLPDRPSSAVCWTAGVSCSGGPGVYDDCVSQDKGMDGLPTADPDEAIVYTMQRYVDALSVVSEQKQLAGGPGEVLIALMAGVPLDYPDTGFLQYEDSFSEEFNLEYGIGPGCGQGTETITSPPGIPPVRLKELSEAFATESPNVFSICSDDYGIALTDIAAKLSALDERACIGGCVIDLDESTEALEPDCILGEANPNGSPGLAVPPCIVGLDLWDFPTPADNICYRALTDPEGETATPFDDMSPQCVTLGSNLEYVVERRPGTPVPPGVSVEVGCSLQAPIGTTCDEIE